MGISQAHVRLRRGSSSLGPALTVDTQNRGSRAKPRKLERGLLWKIGACKSACVSWGVLKVTSKASPRSHSEKNPRKRFASGQSLGSVQAEVKAQAEF